MKYSRSQEVETRVAVRLPLDQLQPMNLTFDGAVAPWKRHSRFRFARSSMLSTRGVDEKGVGARRTERSSVFGLVAAPPSARATFALCLPPTANPRSTMTSARRVVLGGVRAAMSGSRSAESERGHDVVSQRKRRTRRWNPDGDTLPREVGERPDVAVVDISRSLVTERATCRIGATTSTNLSEDGWETIVSSERHDEASNMPEAMAVVLLVRRLCRLQGCDHLGIGRH